MLYIIIGSSLVLCCERVHLKTCKYFFLFIFFFLFRMPEIGWTWNHMLLSYQETDGRYWNPLCVASEQIWFRASDVVVRKFMSEFELYWAYRFNVPGKLQLLVQSAVHDVSFDESCVMWWGLSLWKYLFYFLIPSDPFWASLSFLVVKLVLASPLRRKVLLK